jgi:NADH dehydrogenase
VVIIGAGFGGLFAARALRRVPVEVTVVDRTNHHLFQPLLYQVATGVLSEGDIAPPIREVLRNQRNARVLLGEVVDIDLGARDVVLDTVGQRTRIPYDSVIVAAGAGQSYFGHDEFAVSAPGMKTIDDALELRGRIFGAFEMAELEPEPTQREAWLTFVVVGAGPTGVELAGQIAELSHRALKRNYRTLDPKSARIILIEATDTVLPPFPDALRRRAHRDLERLGVEVRLRTLVTGVDLGGLDVKQEDQSTGRIQAYTKIWAAGVQASPLGRILAEHSDATVDRAGRVSVLGDCTLPGHPEAFVVGDLMSLDHLPGVAEVAMQSGIHAAHTITRRLSGDTGQRPFRYRDLGTMATIARFRAVVFIGRIRVTGPAAWLLWLVVHLAFLTGYKNRLAAVANWAIAFLGHNRRQRTITEQQVFARTRGETTGGGRAGSGFPQAAERARLSMMWVHADQSGMAGIVKTAKITPLLTLADES